MAPLGECRYHFASFGTNKLKQYVFLIALMHHYTHVIAIVVVSVSLSITLECMVQYIQMFCDRVMFLVFEGQCCSPEMRGSPQMRELTRCSLLKSNNLTNCHDDSDTVPDRIT